MIGPPSYPTKTSPGEGLVRFLSVRLIVSLIIAVAGVSLLFSYHQVAVEKRGRKRDLSKRRAGLAGQFSSGACGRRVHCPDHAGDYPAKRGGPDCQDGTMDSIAAHRQKCAPAGAYGPGTIPTAHQRGE